MAKQAEPSEKGAALLEELAPHVEGKKVVVVARAKTGGFAVGNLRLYLGVLWPMLVKGMREERGMPPTVMLALTADDVYVFRLPAKNGAVSEPLRRWPLASLQSAELRNFGRSLRVFLTLDSGKKAIFMMPKQELIEERLRSVLGANTSADS